MQGQGRRARQRREAQSRGPSIPSQAHIGIKKPIITEVRLGRQQCSSCVACCDVPHSLPLLLLLLLLPSVARLPNVALCHVTRAIPQGLGVTTNGTGQSPSDRANNNY